MILTLNALQKYVYTYTCGIQQFPPWNPLEIPLSLFKSKINIILMILEVNKI